MMWYWVGKRIQVLRASRKNGNRQLGEAGGWGTLQNVPETCEVRDSQVSKRGTLYEMPYSGQRKLVEPTSNRKTMHQVRYGLPPVLTCFMCHLDTGWSYYWERSFSWGSASLRSNCWAFHQRSLPVSSGSLSPPSGLQSFSHTQYQIRFPSPLQSLPTFPPKSFPPSPLMIAFFSLQVGLKDPHLGTSAYRAFWILWTITCVFCMGFLFCFCFCFG
jgi:hypothetical protein